MQGAGVKELAFKYHEFGFLELEPAYPAVRYIYTKNSDGTTVNIENPIQENMVGKYIFLKSKWHKITSQPDEKTLTIEGHSMFQDNFQTTAMQMNEITITPITTMDIHLNFIFKPTYA